MAERGEYLLTQSGLQVQTLLDKVQNPATQPEATERLITAGGVQAGLAPKYEKPSGGIPASDLNGNVVSGIVFDVSVNNGGATFASLSALLSSESLSTLIPAEVRKGGMQLRFINSETEQYEQYRLMSAAWSANPTDWQGIDDTPTAGSDNLVKSGGVAGYVSVSQNSQTGKTELKIGNTPALIVDNEPEAGSDNLVKSGGVQNELALGAVYDVTAKNPTAGPNNDGKWASLSALLSDANLSTLIPTAVRKGGMSIKFVCSSDNKYVQFRLMADAFSTTVSDWQGVDEYPTAGSNNLIKSGGIRKQLLAMGGVVHQDSGSGAKCVPYEFIAGLTYVLVNTGDANYTGIMSKSTSDSTSTVGVVETIGSLQPGQIREFTASINASYLRYYGNGDGASFYIVEKNSYAQAIKTLQLTTYTKSEVNYIIGEIFNKSYEDVGNENLDTIRLIKGTYKLYSDIININLYKVVGTVLITTSVPNKWVDFTIDEDMDVLINHSTSQGTTVDCVVKIERGIYHDMEIATDIVYNNYSSKYFANGVNVPYLPLIKELYLTGLNSSHTYEFRIYKGSSFTAQIWDGSKYVAGAGINFNNQVHKFSPQNSSGISGYIVVDLAKVQESPTLTKEVIVQSVVTNVSESPIIQNYILNKDITVEKDGSGDFSSLTEAILFATKWMDRTVRVGDGTYDIKAEYEALYGDDYFDTWHDDVGIVLKNRVHIIFNTNSKVVYNYTGSNASYLSLFSPFNAGSGGFTLENLTIECSNCRYCVHDDPNGSIKYHNKYTNCTMKMDNSGNTEWSSKQCIGGGMSLSGRVDILNCRFNSVGITSQRPDIVSYHNTSLANAKTNIVVSGCYFEGIGTFRLSWHGTTTLISTAEVSNCNLGSELIHVAESSSYDVRNTELIAWNNEIRV